MTAMTAVQFLINSIITGKVPPTLFEQAIEMEKKQLSDAINYALDEDGHTGDWKIKFINDYYERNFGVRPQ